MVFSRDEARVVTASSDATARVWDARTGQAISTVEGHEGEIHAAAFSADGEVVFTASRDQAIGVWAAATGELVTEFGPLDGMAMMPKEMLNVMTVEGRSLFVPVLAINLRYEWDGGSGQTATSYVIGIDRGEGAKLAPFRLDGASRMRDDVSQIPYTVSMRR